MSENIDQTRNKNLSEVFFTLKANELLVSLGVGPLQTKEKSLQFIGDIDNTIDTLISQMEKTNSSYSDKTILLLGSLIGEAFNMIFDGHWKFSNSQERWVVDCETLNGDNLEFNVFNKIEKRLKNGAEDSIEYYFNLNTKIFLGEAMV